MARRRLRGWQPPLENINALVASGGPRLLARARELVVTNGYAANACEAFASNLVGDGIKPSSLIEDAALRDRVQRLWLAWTDEADADGLTDFYGLQAMAAREMFVAGECFVRMRPRRAEDGLTVPLQLQLLQAEMLPFEKTEELEGGRRIRCGIEFDAIGRRIAYHFRRRIRATAPIGVLRSPRRCACRLRKCCTSTAPWTQARSAACRTWHRAWSGSSCSTSTTTPSSIGRRRRQCSRASSPRPRRRRAFSETAIPARTARPRQASSPERCRCCSRART